MGFGPKYRKSRPSVKVAMQTTKPKKGFGFLSFLREDGIKEGKNLRGRSRRSY
jgi:hypothetical protein